MHLDIDYESVEGKLAQNVHDVLVQHSGQLYCPEGEDEMDAYQHAVRGKCMVDGAPLEGDTILLVDDRGILGIWCSPRCMAESHAISFIENIAMNLVEGIEERERQNSSD